MADNELNIIDDRFPFDLTKTLDYNLGIMKRKLRVSGMDEKEIDQFITETKAKYFNEDGTRKA